MRVQVKTLMRGLGLGLLGFGLILVGPLISSSIPGLPVSAGNTLLRLAAAGKGQTVPTWLAAEVLSESAWYQRAVLPGLVGIIEGLLLGAFLRLTVFELLVAGFITTTLLVVTDLVSWSFNSGVGPVLYLFCLSGAVQLISALRQHREAPARGA